MKHRLLAQRMAEVPASFIREILKVTEQPGIISFAGGLPNAALFPLQALRLATESVLRTEGPTAPAKAIQDCANGSPNAIGNASACTSRWSRS